MPDTSLRRFVGDSIRILKLDSRMMAELQRKTGFGIGALHTRILNRDFGHADLLEIIRCGLIGGGASPGDADHLVRTYAEPAPIIVPYGLALAIMVAAFEGSDAVEHDEEAPSLRPTLADVAEVFARTDAESEVLRAFSTNRARANGPAHLDMDAMIAADAANEAAS